MIFLLPGLEKGERFILVTGATVTQTRIGTDASGGLAIVNRGAVRMFRAARR